MSSGQPFSLFFNENGRRVLSSSYRVFDNEDLDYYFIQNNSVVLDNILKNFHNVGIGTNVDLDTFESSLNKLKRRFLGLAAFRNLFNGVHVPFIVPRIDSKNIDLGFNSVERFLPKLESSFLQYYPNAHFKAVMQGGSTLAGNLEVNQQSRYQKFLNTVNVADAVGWYFPQALQQFDTDSQVAQIKDLPDEAGVCVSGPMEIFSANIGKPDLLINSEGYAPILTMPAVRHVDDTLTLALKSYGPHLEFWCLSNMLIPGIKQISEQWAGGITLYCELS
jgi:hypothetical protein